MRKTPRSSRELSWRKAECSLAHGACVEVALAGDLIVLRNSRHPEGAMLAYSPAEWRAFLHGAKRGEFDDIC